MKNKLYIIYDKVIGRENAVFMSVNDKACIRELTFCNYFKINRIDDTEIFCSGLIIDGKGETIQECEPYALDIRYFLKELSFEMEEEAKKIEGTEEEVKKEILDETKKKK